MRLWILHASKGDYREAVVFLDEHLLREAEIPLLGKISLKAVAENFLGDGWDVEQLVEVSVCQSINLPYGELMEREW